MLSPNLDLIVLGGLILSPLFAAICAGVAQWRWRRRVTILSNKGLMIGAAQRPQTVPSLLVLGIGAGLLLAILSTVIEDTSAGQATDPGLAVVRWAALLVILSTMVISIRLALTGMPPEPNFVLTPDHPATGGPKPLAAPLGSAADLFDAREL